MTLDLEASYMHSTVTSSLLPANGITLADILYVAQRDIAHETPQRALLIPRDILVGTTILTLLNQSAAFDTKIEETINNSIHQK